MLRDLTDAAKQELADQLVSVIQGYRKEARAKWAAAKAAKWEPTTTLRLQTDFALLHGRILGIIETCSVLGLPVEGLFELLPDDWTESAELAGMDQ